MIRIYSIKQALSLRGTLNPKNRPEQKNLIRSPSGAFCLLTQFALH
jgi:hypothetical protein